MSKRLGLLVMVVLMLCTTSAVVSAKELPLTVSGGYLVVPAHNTTGMKPLTVYDSITQGETNWEDQQVSSYTNTLNIDLDWGKTVNSLQLTVYSPDGHIFGPYYDNYDGVIDGRINLYIENTDGIAEGTWYYKVYGYSVSGTQTYSI